jgi:aryl-alcohol dehydrogenase-like predicted oxidoreductase
VRIVPEKQLVEQRNVGSSGVELSRIVLGCGNFGGVGSAPAFFGQGESEAEAFAIMDAAWERGITAFDTADAYGGGRSETAIGKWLAARDRRPVLTTKTYNPMANGGDHGLSRVRIERQIQSSLERLGVESVELYLAHDFDAETPLAETVEAFESLLRRGLIRAWGVSNVDAVQLKATLEIGRPALVQNSFSLLDRGDGRTVLPVCAEHGIAYEAFSPLAGGWLTGRYRRGEPAPPGSRMTQRPEPYEHLRTDAVFDALDGLERLAGERGAEMATLALAWLFAQPGVTAAVVGPRRPEHLEAATAALELDLSGDELDEVGSLFVLD